MHQRNSTWLVQNKQNTFVTETYCFACVLLTNQVNFLRLLLPSISWMTRMKRVITLSIERKYFKDNYNLLSFYSDWMLYENNRCKFNNCGYRLLYWHGDDITWTSVFSNHIPKVNSKHLPKPSNGKSLLVFNIVTWWLSLEKAHTVGIHLQVVHERLILLPLYL